MKSPAELDSFNPAAASKTQLEAMVLALLEQVKSSGLLCERTRIKYGFIQAQQKTYPITVLCKVMLVSTSAYYAWVKQPEDTDKYTKQQKLEQQTVKIFEASKCSYGSRRLSDALKKADFPVGRDKARRLMAKLNLKARYPKRFKVTTDSNNNDANSPNLLNRQFNVATPNQVWTTDITYVWTLEGWLHVAVVVDFFSRQVVGWAIDDHLRTLLCVQALQIAFLPNGHKGEGSRTQDCFTIQIEAANMPALNTAGI